LNDNQMIKKNQIILGDCLDSFQKLPNDSVQVVFADPPFNLDKAYNLYQDTMKSDAYVTWCRNWIVEAVRVLKPGGSLFLHNIPKWLSIFTCALSEIDNMEFRHWIAWDAPTKPMGKSLQPAHYGILYYAKSPIKNLYFPKRQQSITFNEIRLPHKRCRVCNCLMADYGGKKELIPPHGPLASDVWKDIHRLKHKKFRSEHPCQLPVALLERIILMSSLPEDIILDPFIGAGSTAIAAKRLGRDFIGFEIDEKYIDITNKRIERQKIQSKFNGIFVGCQRNEIISAIDSDIKTDAWKSIFDDFPDTPEKRKKLEKKGMKLKPEYKSLVHALEYQLIESTI
jgi:site-specific DNA-methyltransferase (adenine-specific)